eukprot:TRINITY_DN1966_c0_g2_i1.p1 TRINITY_DN1966_c0_g2~~TRINITY_DN1966_c0_g2_i1.p1  ORF type:complete len:260 (-),score=104.25 TRINITY_DN1966_c0_g2_i1:447-1226(-)
MNDSMKKGFLQKKRPMKNIEKPKQKPSNLKKKDNIKQRLLREDIGLPKLMNEYKNLQIKGTEKNALEDLSSILSYLKQWAANCNPAFVGNFSDYLQKVSNCYNQDLAFRDKVATLMHEVGGYRFADEEEMEEAEEMELEIDERDLVNAGRIRLQHVDRMANSKKTPEFPFVEEEEEEFIESDYEYDVIGENTPNTIQTSSVGMSTEMDEQDLAIRGFEAIMNDVNIENIFDEQEREIAVFEALQNQKNDSDDDELEAFN